MACVSVCGEYDRSQAKRYSFKENSVVFMEGVQVHISQEEKLTRSHCFRI